MLFSFLRRALMADPNPIGFGPADFLELGFAALVLIAILAWRPWIAPRVSRLARRAWISMLLLAAIPVVLRLLLLAHHPVPTPDIYDEFSHLLAADTLRHFRLANPPHSLPQFFETFFVLQQPTYSSIYPLGQGLVMALGWMLFGLPWAGVLLGVAGLCSLCYWMLRGWTTPGWALAGGVLAAMEFGPLSQWTNSYWGGAPAAAAGCLVFGALPRLRESARPLDAVLLGAGLGLHFLIRPFESIFLFLAVALFFLPEIRRVRLFRIPVRLAGFALVAFAPAVLLTLAHNRAVTGAWLTMPEQLSQYQYGVPAGFTFQSAPVPHRALTPEQAMDYRMQMAFHQGPETPATYLERMEYRIRYYRFFFLPPLYLAALAFLSSLRQYRFLWVALTLALFALGTNFFPAFQFHYIAAVTCLFVLVVITGLQRLARVTIHGHSAGWEAAALILCVSGAQFFFWYAVHAADNSDFSMAVRPYETWNAINHQNPARRVAVAHALDRIPGRLLVFVRYAPHHIFQNEWVYNEAEIDSARIVWARDLGAAENEKLLRYYPSRTVLLLQPDLPEVGLSRYESATYSTP